MTSQNNTNESQTLLPSRRAVPLGSQAVYLWAFVLILFGTVYLSTSQRSVSWQDSGMYQSRVPSGDKATDLTRPI